MKWEYTILKRPASTFASDLCVTDLNVLGESGWELIAVVGTEVFIFKRPLGEAFGKGHFTTGLSLTRILVWKRSKRRISLA